MSPITRRLSRSKGAYHQPDASYDALNQQTLYTYNGNRQATSINSPAGLTTTNIYFASGTDANRLDRTIGLEISRTNSYTYNSGLVYSHTDERGLTTTTYWDNLLRLTGMTYPDSSSISNIYTYLDVTATKDRLGYWSYAGYNPIRQKIAETNASGVITRYGYCDCGALMSVTNAWNTTVQQVNSFAYDYQGNRTITYGPDGYNVTNWFDPMRQIYQTGDGSGYRYFSYNNQGLLTTVSTAYGAEQSTVYDVEDRALYVTDANGVTVTNTFDDLGRLRTRGYPDGGIEKFGYSARGLIAYTNQLGLTNFYAYDQAGRKSFETNANNELILYTNSAAGDLLSLTDGKGQTTRWTYDPYGRVTNKLDQASVEILRYKYDADNRVTNRWSAAKGNTYYGYDAVGNLTNVDYPASTDVKFQYDPLNRLTNMVDAAGTTKYTYTAGNQILTDDGPFTSDTVTNAYSNRLRTSLSLQQPTGAWTNAFRYDAARRLTSVTSSAGSFTNEYSTGVGGASGYSSHLIKRLLLPNTSIITNDFDSAARLSGTYLRNNSGTLTNKHEYTYNLANQRTNETRMDASTVAYNYDRIGQLTVADSSVNTEDRGFYYDAAWNLNRRTNNGVPTGFSVDSKNQLTSGPGGSFTYDSNGNLSSSPPGPGYQTYTYDDENRLINVQFYTTWRTDFVYDGLGRLRKRLEYSGGSWVLQSTTYYIYDGNRVIQERDGSNNPLVSYTRGNDLSGSLEGAGGIGGLLARSHGYSGGNWSTHNFYHADGNGNVTFMLNSSQSFVAKYRYDPFGNTISSSGTLASANIYRFSSKEIHINSGMYYYLYRFYDPNLQRWLSRDPLGEPGFEAIRSANRVVNAEAVVHLPTPARVTTAMGAIESANLYTFVKNHPTGMFDPFGLRHWYYLWQAGKLCISENCSKTCPVKYLDEDDWSKGFLNAPAPGKCASADAVATPGFYLKIPDNCRVTVECYSEDSWLHDEPPRKGKIRELTVTCSGLLLPRVGPAPVPPFPPSPYQ